MGHRACLDSPGCSDLEIKGASQLVLMGKNLPASAGGRDSDRSLCLEDALEEGMATHSSILAWTGEPGWLHSIGSERVRHD